MVLLVTCDLKSRKRSRFLEALDFMGPCCRINDPTYLISTNRSPESVAGELKHYCESGDTFSVEHPNPDYIRALPEHAQRWLSRRAKYASPR